VPVAVSVCVGGVLTVVVAAGIRRAGARMVEAEFQRAADLRIGAVRRVLAGHLGALRATVSFYYASQVVDRDEFRTFVTTLLEDNLGLRAIEWIPRVPAAERHRCEAEARDEGFAGYAFRGVDGTVVPLQDEDHFPVLFVEPLLGNEQALGLDFARDPERRSALQQAMESGRMAATPALVLVTADRVRDGVLILMPVWSERRAPAATPAARQGNLQGFVAGVVRMSKILEVALADLGPAIAATIEETAANGARVVRASHPAEVVPREGAHELEGTVEVGGREWVVRCRDTGSNAQAIVQEILVLGAGLLLTLLLAGYVRVLVRRGETEAALRASEARTRAVIDSALDAIVTIDAGGAITAWNPRAQAIFGWADDEAIGRSIAELVIAERHRARLHDYMAAAEDGRRARKTLMELRALRRDGEEFPIELAITSMPPRSDHRFSVFVRDISWRKLAEQELKESEKRYRILVEHAPEAMVVLDVDSGRFIDANQNAERLFKLDRELLLQSGPVGLSPPRQPDGRPSGETAADYIAAALAGGTPAFPWTHRAADGSDVPCEVRLVSLPHATRRLVRGSITDVTERARAAQRQTLMMRELDHRVKNNLAMLLALAEQTASHVASLDEFRDAFIHRVRAMARTHEALAAGSWDGVPLGEVVRLMLAPYARGGPERIVAGGDLVVLTPSASATMSMAMHELAINAAKHGALSQAGGRIALRWARENGDLRIDWIESGGPTVAPPTHHGFGTTLLRGVIEHELGGSVQLDYAGEGLRCRIRVPLDRSVAVAQPTRRPESQ
jgi:PAS domain S-box-containing protein